MLTYISTPHVRICNGKYLVTYVFTAIRIRVFTCIWHAYEYVSMMIFTYTLRYFTHSLCILFKGVSYEVTCNQLKNRFTSEPQGIFISVPFTFGTYCYGNVRIN